MLKQATYNSDSLDTINVSGNVEPDLCDVALYTEHSGVKFVTKSEIGVESNNFMIFMTSYMIVLASAHAAIRSIYIVLAWTNKPYIAWGWWIH